MQIADKENEIVLYSVVTTYHLLEAIVHKLRYNEKKRSVLMISRWLASKYPWYENLKIFFEQVAVYNADFKYSEKMIEELDLYYDSFFKENGILLGEFGEIHLFGAEHSFGAYVFSNQIENYFWEEGAGALSKKESMLELFQKTYGIEKAQFQYENHLGDGEVPFVKGRYYNSYFQLKKVEGENLIHFDIAEELRQLKEEDINKVVGLFYSDAKIQSDQTYALILTEHFANLSVMTWEEQLFMYRYLADYFLSGYHLLIKPHPDDIMYYEYEFNDCIVIRKRFPAELLPFIFRGMPEVVATASSTSIYGLRRQFSKVLEFNFRFSHEKQFYKLNRYFVALSVADKYIKEGCHLKLLGVNPVIVENFYKFCGIGAKEYTEYEEAEENLDADGRKTVWIVDEIKNPHTEAEKITKWLSRLPESSMVVFINSDESFCFYDYNYKNIWQDIQPVGVNTEAMEGMEHTVSFAGPSMREEKQEMIYIYSKGEKMLMYEIERELPHVGISVSAENFNGDKMQIKLLEGMLAATEKRLLYYIEREKELLERKEEEGR